MILVVLGLMACAGHLWLKINDGGAYTSLSAILLRAMALVQDIAFLAVISVNIYHHRIRKDTKGFFDLDNFILLVVLIILAAMSLGYCVWYACQQNSINVITRWPKSIFIILSILLFISGTFLCLAVMFSFLLKPSWPASMYKNVVILFLIGLVTSIGLSIVVFMETVANN